MSLRTLQVAIVNFGLGNLFSVQRACERVGLHATITSSKQDVLSADAVLLPGVGAFGEAINNLRRADLVEPLRDISQAGLPLIGICLGQQLLMSESEEFGSHRGLDLIQGPVVRFRQPLASRGEILKVPQVGWNRICRPGGPDTNAWHGSPLCALDDGAYMYFVHSYYVKPVDPGVQLSMTKYGDIEFCSSVRIRNTCAFQFHPEKSGGDGLEIYRGIVSFIASCQTEKEKRHAA